VPEFELETRVLVQAPTRTDADVTKRIFAEAQLVCECCETAAELIRETRRGAGAILLTDDFLAAEEFIELRSIIDRQPEWSELPVLLMARSDAEGLERFRQVPGLVLLERPSSVRSLVSALQAAIRARLRQYELRNQLDRTQTANRELEQSAKAKDNFLATLSHELRNPLSALMTSVRVLEKVDLSGDDAEHARQIVIRQASQMAHLLDELLDVARITRGRLEIKKSIVRVSDVVHAAIETAQPLFSRKHHSFDLQMPEPDLAIDADPVRLAQILANLLTNAAKYTEPGGRVSLAVTAAGQNVEFRISDTGIGIAPDSLQDIFTMFSQLNPAIERSEGGLGIGLALTKGLVDLHGGQVLARSEGAGRGSEFVVTLPGRVRTSALETSVPESSARNSQTRPLDIIAADDNHDALDSLSVLLKLEGFSVRLAGDGAEAMRLFDQRRPDVMLLDIGMPLLNGYEVAKLARAQAPDAKLLLVALTGWGQPADRQKAAEAGFSHHLTKPLDLDDLMSLLAKAAANTEPLQDHG